MKKLYEKSKIVFAVTWIIAYCVLMSAGDAFSGMLGVEKSVTLIIGVGLSAVLLLFLWNNKLFDRYGLCLPKVPPRAMLYYIPVIVMLTANLWYGVTCNYGIIETVLYMLSMLCVGFLEEVIFRGLLFEAMREDGLKSAVIVSSVTFGMGHIINLFNGSGAQLLPNLLQILYATAVGFMFVMMYLKSKSLLVCIAAHGIFNAFNVFADESAVTDSMQIITAILLTVITGGYAGYLAYSMKGMWNKHDT